MENAYILEMTSFSIRATRRACKKRCHFRQTQFAISNKWQQHASHIPDDVRLSDVSNARKWFISHKNCQTNQFGCWQSQPSQSDPISNHSKYRIVLLLLFSVRFVALIKSILFSIYCHKFVGEFLPSSEMLKACAQRRREKKQQQQRTLYFYAKWIKLKCYEVGTPNWNIFI